MPSVPDLHQFDAFLAQRRIVPERQTTMLYTHVIRNLADAPESPLDVLEHAG